MLFEIDNYGLEIKFGCMLSSENGCGRSNFLFDFIWGRLIEGKMGFLGVMCNSENGCGDFSRF